MRLFLLSGERSGDRHGAGVMEELRARVPGIEFHGLGGAEMHALCPDIPDWVEEAGVVGLVEVLKKYGWFRRKFAETLQRIETLKPDAVVLIDYPGFNLRIAKTLRQRGFRGKIIYYISPQVWAWHRGRIPKMGHWLDLMICIFPFEKELYESSGLHTVFGGHPLVEYHRSRRLAIPREPGLIGLFPGSRRREIAKHFPALLDAAQRMKIERPALKFVASAASEKLAATMRGMLAENPVADLTIETGTVHTLMQKVACGAVASGTATLEAAIHELPYCLIYKVSPGTYLAARMLMRVPYLGIVNILAGKELVKELLQGDCTGKKIAAELLRLSDDSRARAALTDELREIVNTLAGEGAYGRAAEAILTAVNGAK
ncbi:MAG TPA: lipid-A-disaccharide synthase [Verrucomicrobiales bacterium]|nr:lipid-A-disaccharide synthase [Verrucomicrobiales bacterium]